MEKSAIEKMVEWLEYAIKAQSKITKDNMYAVVVKLVLESILIEARRLAAEEKATALAESKPTAPASLVAELKVLVDSITPNSISFYIRKDIMGILSRYQPAESLAELADRKGYHISRQMCRFKSTKAEWIINLAPNVYDYNPQFFVGNYYAEAESKAREYLNGLTDPK